MFLSGYITDTQIISRQIAEHGNLGKQQIEFITAVISEFDGSPYRTYMDVASEYYSNNNDINEAKRMVIGRDPTTKAAILLESTVLSNNKLNHNFLKKLTRQKIGYMLGKPFSLTPKLPDDTRADKFFNLLDDYFNFEFFKLLKNVARDSIIKAIGWILVYYDEEGNFKLKRIPSEEVIPLWADSDHTVLDAVIRKFNIEVYVDGEKSLLKLVDYYTREGVFHYKYNDNGKLIPLGDGPEPNFYAKMIDKETGVESEIPVRWSRIPFVAFKYDPDEQCLLARIKSLVDDYDKKTSGVANNIDDFPNSVTVIKNYDGRDKEEFIHNKNQYRTLFVQGDGDAKPLETKLDVTETDIHLKRLREDIYEFGQGVNTADKDIRDTSGVALRFMYADLDMDCLDWSSELDWGLRQLLWFICQDLAGKGKGNFEDVKYNIVFNTDVIINETETIQNCFTSMGVISEETIAANHPWTIKAEKEMQQKYSDTKEDLELEKRYATKPATNPSQGQRTAK